MNLFSTIDLPLVGRCHPPTLRYKTWLIFLAGIYETGFGGYYISVHLFISEIEKNIASSNLEEIVPDSLNSIAATSGDSKQ
jgi:hypothetical protein